MLVRQQQQIALLIRELSALRTQRDAADGATPRNLRDELPPHD